jgi:hypothetical protein
MVEITVVVAGTVTVWLMVLVCCRLTSRPILSSFWERASKFGDVKIVTAGFSACVSGAIEDGSVPSVIGVLGALGVRFTFLFTVTVA